MKQIETEIPKPLFYRRVKTPTVVQMEAIECGAACLGMILGYYEKYITLEELRVACGVSRDGVSALSILQAAQKYELFCEGYKVELEELYDLPLPLIAHWNFNHFVVIEGFSKHYVYINDPSSGPLRISYKELDGSFTGLALIFEKRPEFKKSGSPESGFKLILERMKNFKVSLLFLILTGIAAIFPKLAMPAFTQIFIDNILTKQSSTWSGWTLFAMAVAMALAALFSFLQSFAASRLTIEMSINFSSNFLRHLMYLPLSFYYQRLTGEVANRINLNDNISDTVAQKLIGMFIDAFSTVLFGIVMFYYDPFIALFGILMTLCNLGLMRYLYRKWIDAYAYYQKAIGKSYAYSISSLQSIETIKATTIESKIFSKWAGYYTKTSNSVQQIARNQVYGGIIPSFLAALTSVVIIGVGSWRVINGNLTIGMLMALQILMQNFMGPIVRLVSSLQSIQFVIVDFNRVNDVLKNPLEKRLMQEENNPLTPQFQKSPKLGGYLELKNVSFRFNPFSDLILNDINFTLEPGKTVALVGPTGCGKSTTVKIIGGLVYPLQGEVLFDRIKREKLPREVITNSLAIVEQEPFLFAGTVKENLTLFEGFVEEDILIQAAEDACIHEMIISRLGGYEMKLENEGTNLSGGQRQQLEIARALIKQPTLLVLDEATSNMDSDTELKIFQNIRRRGCACVIIAHRLSTIRYCNEILVMDNGKIVQRGNHDELMSLEGMYKQLNEAEKLDAKN